MLQCYCPKKKVGGTEIMTEFEDSLLICLEESGNSDIAGEAKELYRDGRTDELMKLLRRKRCDLIDDMHLSQRKVDRLDYIIRQAEKEIN